MSKIDEQKSLLQQDKGEDSTLSHGFCEEQAFRYLFLKVKSAYNSPRDIPIRPARYFNQKLLNVSQQFASDANYIFFARFVYGQHHLH